MFDDIVSKIRDAIASLDDENKAYGLLEQVIEDIEEAKNEEEVSLYEVKNIIENAMHEFSADPLDETGRRDVTNGLKDAITVLNEIAELVICEGSKS